jgi:hypothetical protein
MKKSLSQYQQINMSYLANLDSYDILNNSELVWLLESNIAEERIIAAQLLRDRKISSMVETLNNQKN